MEPVCLIIPPSPFLLDERVFMSLGVLKVAAALERAGVAVEVLDLSGVKNFEAAVSAHLRQSSVSCYGITATSPQLPAAVKIADLIMAAETTVPRRRYRVILGGPHVTLVWAAAKRETKLQIRGRAHRALNKLWLHFNVLVAGDGERAILDAMQGDPPRLIDADDRHSPFWQSGADLDAAAFPARHLVDVASYRYQIDGVPALSLIAQLGCPFGCGFCAGRHSPMLRHIRTRSSENIVAEMTEMHERYGARGFMFYDDELNVNKDFVRLLDAIAYQQYHVLKTKWKLRGFIKAELFTAEQAAAMRFAGFRWILVGFESGSERILANINKKATQADNTRCIEIARRHGLKVKALMSIGHPGESIETVKETYWWLRNQRPDDFDVTIITPYPGSPYYDEAEKAPPRMGVSELREVWAYTARNGDRLYQDEVDYTLEADYYKGVPGGGYVARVWTDTLSPGDLVAWRDYLERELRGLLNIPFNPAAPSVAYEHSMGQTALPPSILKRPESVSHGRLD